MCIAIDPVCGRELEPEEAETALLYSDCEAMRLHFCSPCSNLETCRFHFCSPECKSKFDVDPSFDSNLAGGGESPKRRGQQPV